MIHKIAPFLEGDRERDAGGALSGRMVWSLINYRKEGKKMSQFTFKISQTNDYRVEITAKSEEEARRIFNEYLTEDYGDPENSVTTYEITKGEL